MPYNFVSDGFHTNKLCSRLSSSEVRFSTENCCFAVLYPPIGGLMDNIGAYTMFILGSLESA